MDRHYLNHTTPFRLMTQLSPGNFSIHISWLQRLLTVRKDMVHVAALREVRCSRIAYRGNETAEGILQQAGSLRMDLMDSLMAMCDMPAPGGDIRILVEWLNGHLDRLESRWDSHKEWLERRHVIRRARWEENRQRLERQYLLRRARQRQRTNPEYAPSAQLITSLFITNEMVSV